MCGLILVKGDRREAVFKALDAMSYRGLDGKQGITQMAGWTLGHVRLAIQDLSDASAQPIELEDGGAFAFVGELFGHGKASDLVVARDTYDLRGFAGFHAFDGFWAMAAVHPDGYAEVATDYLGQKPLYYWADRGIVCSELEPMFAIAPRPQLDEVYLSNCIKFGYDYSGRTPYVGIQQLAPGHRLCFDPQVSTPEALPYWSWAQVQAPVVSVGGLRDELLRACANRMTSDRPVGLLLSGGLDSSLVYAMLKSMGHNPQCFSIENGETEFLPAGVTALPEGEVGVDEVLQAMQAPLDLGSMLPQYVLGQRLKEQGLRVCLSGDGADELFGGYSRSQDYDSQHSDVFCELPYYHLPRLDRLMMRHTVELRTPFLAPSVVALALRLPQDLRTGKEILKRIASDFLPAKIIDRPKVALKSAIVRQGGLHYRKLLVHQFRQQHLKAVERQA